jgi:hypothetical protein
MLDSPEHGFTNPLRSFVLGIGSLWFAAVLLILLLVAMACATVVEASRGTEQALAAFYMSRWFTVLLALLAVNVFVALALRFPFTKRQVGFVVTHVSILMVLGGALISKEFSMHGRVAPQEGQTVTHFIDFDHYELAMVRESDQMRSAVDLDGTIFAGFERVVNPPAPVLVMDDARVEITEYLPDSEWQRRVLDDESDFHPAVEVSLSGGDSTDAVWVFTGRGAEPGSIRTTLRVVTDDAEWTDLLSGQVDEEAQSDGALQVEYENRSYRFSMAECLKEAMPLGETGLTVRTLQYLPDATVGSKGRITSASDQPNNPAVEVEIIGPDVRDRRVAFANFPDFSHGKEVIEGLKLIFLAPSGTAPPVEILLRPDDDTYVRFYAQDQQTLPTKLTAGESVETPWPGREMVMLRRFDHARVDHVLVEVNPARATRIPAVRVEARHGDQTDERWLQKHRAVSLLLGGNKYQVGFVSGKQVPLGFDLTLDSFRVGYYPGGMRPRSYESRVTIHNPSTERTQSRVIWMNHPTSYGGYTFYQSEFDQRDGRMISVLSVARDPGQALVFAGYISMLIGMLIVLGTRIVDHRRSGHAHSMEIGIRNPRVPASHPPSPAADKEVE